MTSLIINYKKLFTKIIVSFLVNNFLFLLENNIKRYFMVKCDKRKQQNQNYFVILVLFFSFRAFSFRLFVRLGNDSIILS